MYKVQLTFTTEEANVLAAKAAKLGYSVTKFIKLLLGREVLSEIEKYPTFTLSPKAVKKVEKAHEEHKKATTFRLVSPEDLDKL